MDPVTSEDCESRRKIMAVNYVEVDYVDDPVRCPECRKEARKGAGVERPGVPLTDTKSKESTSECVGRAYCENLECSLHARNDWIDWSFWFPRTAQLT